MGGVDLTDAEQSGILTVASESPKVERVSFDRIKPRKAIYGDDPIPLDDFVRYEQAFDKYTAHISRLADGTPVIEKVTGPEA